MSCSKKDNRRLLHNNCQNKIFYVEDIGEDVSKVERDFRVEKQLKTILRRFLLKSRKLKKLKLSNVLSPFLLTDIAQYFSVPPLSFLDLSDNFLDGKDAKNLLKWFKGREKFKLRLKHNLIFPFEIDRLYEEFTGFFIDFSNQDSIDPENE